MEVARKPLMGMNLLELKTVAKELGMPAFTGGQMAKWLYTQHITSIDEMTNLSKVNREKLKAAYTIGCKKHIDAQYSKDGTIKYLFPTDDGKFVESVYIPRRRPCHALRFVASGLQNELPFLSDRQARLRG